MIHAPGSLPIVQFQRAESTDADALVALRIAAMRESLERIRRFDPQRARERFLSSFDPTRTRHIVVDGHRVGFVVTTPQAEWLSLDHLYIASVKPRVAASALRCWRTSSMNRGGSACRCGSGR